MAATISTSAADSRRAVAITTCLSGGHPRPRASWESMYHSASVYRRSRASSTWSYLRSTTLPPPPPSPYPDSPAPAAPKRSTQSSPRRRRTIAAKLHRPSRSLVYFAGLMARAQAGRLDVVALDLGIDLATPAGEFTANVLASAAQWERRIIGQRTREALAVRRTQGVRLGRPNVLDPESSSASSLGTKRAPAGLPSLTTSTKMSSPQPMGNKTASQHCPAESERKSC